MSAKIPLCMNTILLLRITALLDTNRKGAQNIVFQVAELRKHTENDVQQIQKTLASSNIDSERMTYRFVGLS